VAQFGSLSDDWAMKELQGSTDGKSAELPLASNQEICMAAVAINLSDILKDIPAGAWVALEQYRVVAYGADMQQVLAEARRKGVPNPLIVKAPERQETMFL
jgi:hypothetical protein